MTNDLVSVIMPSYNCGRFVEETIRSVQAQTYQNWEIIFVDDCSKDDTIPKVMAMRENDERIHVYQNPQNSGAAVSRNNALKRAQGRWIAFLDSDDLWTPNKLEKQLKFMVEHNYHFSYTGYCEMNQEGTDMRKLISGPKHISKVGMYAFCWPGCLTVMYDYEHVGLVQIADIKKNNDYAIWLKVIQKADCYILDECLAKYRRGRKGSVSTHGYATMIRWHYKLWHEAMGVNVFRSVFWTGINLLCGVFKKLHYVKQKQKDGHGR